jgi:hypothetical protein
MKRQQLGLLTITAVITIIIAPITVLLPQVMVMVVLVAPINEFLLIVE